MGKTMYSKVFGGWLIGKPYQANGHWNCDVSNGRNAQVSFTMYGSTPEIVKMAAEHLVWCNDMMEKLGDKL